MNSPASSRPVNAMVAILCGLLAVPLSLLFQNGMLSWLKGPERTVLPMLWVGALAGFIIGCLSATKSANKSFFEEAPTKAGFLCSFVSASALVVYTSILYGRAGHVVSAALLTLFVAVVGVLPSTLFAAFFGGVGTAMRVSLAANRATGKPKFRLRPMHGIYLLCILGLLSPFIPGIFREPAPPPRVPVVAAATPPPKKTELPPRPPEPPPFKYERPSEFDTAEPERIDVVAQKYLPEVNATHPVLFSPDGKKLAFLRAEENPILVVKDMQSFTDIATLRLIAFPTSLTWSPDGEKLIGLFQSNDVRSISVVFPESSRIISLPRPESSTLLSGSLDWPDTNHVVLHRGREKALCLDLETLDFRPLEDAAFFRSLDTLAKTRFQNPPTAIFPRSSSWSLEIAWGLRSSRQLQIDGPPIFQFNGEPGVFICSNSKPIRRRLSDITMGTENLVLFSPERSKVLVLQGTNGRVFYLGLGKPAKNIFRIATGKRLDELPNAELLKKALSEKHLCAFINTPLANPLNDKVVGPASHLKGVARLLNWDGTSADLLIEDTYFPIVPTDIVSTLFEWRNKLPTPFSDPKIPEWWTALGDSPGGVEYKGPPRIEDSFASQGAQLDFFPLDKLISFHLAPPKAPPQPPTAKRDELPPASSLLLTKNQLRDTAEFIQLHHQKSERGDIQGMLKDYADQIEHFDKGLVDRAYIRAEEEKYHTPGFSIYERVRGDLRMFALPGEHVRVEYALQFLRVAPDASWTKGMADVVLELVFTPEGLRIVKQNSVPRDKERQKGRGNIPYLAP